MSYLKVEEIPEDDEVGQIIKEEMLSTAAVRKYILVGEDKTCISAHFPNYGVHIKNFEVRNSDIFIAAFPKTGTTLMQEMVWLIANDLDFKTAAERLLDDDRVPWLEGLLYPHCKQIAELVGLSKPSFDLLAKANNRRIVKTHLPFSLLPDEICSGAKLPKIICTIRDPKDVCVSYLHFGNTFMGWNAKLENFAKVFMADKVPLCPFWKHVLGYWNKRHEPNFLIVKYEDMRADLAAVIKRVANFLDKELNEEQVRKLCQHLSFASMKENRSVNLKPRQETLMRLGLLDKEGDFIRTGTVGKYKEEMSAETIKKFDDWIKKNTVGTCLENIFI